jgi:hypothetical protein
MRTKRSTRTATVGLIAVLLVGYAGAGVAVAVQDDGGTANVRVAHMSPDAPPVDILVDNETVVENLSFGNVTDYLSVPGGERNVTITAAGDQSTVVYSDNVTFEAGTNYTVVAAGEVSEGANTTFQPLVLEDNFTVPGPNEASVRLVHVAPDAPPIDVTVPATNRTLFDNVSFGEATDYVSAQPGSFEVEVRAATANDTGQVVRTFNLSVEGGTVYTAFAAGYLNPQDAPADVPLQAILVTDASAAGNQTTAAADNATTTAAGTATETGTATGTTTESGMNTGTATGTTTESEMNTGTATGTTTESGMNTGTATGTTT